MVVELESVAEFTPSYMARNELVLIHNVTLDDPTFQGPAVEDQILARFGDQLVPLKRGPDECVEAKYTLAEWYRNTDNVRTDKWYVKDFHAFLGAPFGMTCPSMFQDDWLNKYLLARQPGKDYRFLYMGDRGTGTGLHMDVMRSFSWRSFPCAWLCLCVIILRLVVAVTLTLSFRPCRAVPDVVVSIREPHDLCLV